MFKKFDPRTWRGMPPKPELLRLLRYFGHAQAPRPIRHRLRRVRF